MSRLTPAQRSALDQVLQQHDDVLGLNSLDALGIARSTLGRRWQVGGPWQRILPGVVVTHSGPVTDRQRLRAALIYAGSGAILTGNSALRLHGLRASSGGSEAHVLIPIDRRRVGADFVTVERTRRMPSPIVLDALPVAPVARAVLDSVRRLRDVNRARALISEAVQRRRCSTDDLVRELAAGPIRGSSLARKILLEVVDGVRSVSEGQARALLIAAQLPMPAWNVDLYSEDDLWIACPDGYWDAGVAWQIDSYEWHLSPQAYRLTLARHGALSAHGIRVVHTLPSQLIKQPAAVVAELRAALTFAQASPRPLVRSRLAA